MNNKLLIKTLLLLMILCGLFFYYQSRVPRAPLHTDERYWIAYGAVYFDLAVLKHDFSNPEWQLYPSYEESKLPEFIYGSFLYIAYRQSPVKTLYDPNSDTTMLEVRRNEWEKQVNTPLNQIPEKFRRNIEVTLLCRRLNVFFGIACLLLMFFIGKRLQNYFLGLIALLTLAINPLFQSELFTAKADIIFLCTLLVTFYLSLIYLDKSILKNLILLSIFAGLTAAAKLHGLFVICVLALGLAGKSIINRQFKKTLLHISLLLVVAFTVFISINPFTWTGPIRNTAYMLNSRYNISREFCSNRPNNCAPSLKQRFINLNNDLIGTVNKYGTFHLVPWVDTILLFAGSVVLIKVWKRNRLTYTWFVFWGVVVVLFITSIMFFRFPRYNMIMVPWICIIESFGLVGIIQTARARSKRFLKKLVQ